MLQPTHPARRAVGASGLRALDSGKRKSEVRNKNHASRTDQDASVVLHHVQVRSAVFHELRRFISEYAESKIFAPKGLD